MSERGKRLAAISNCLDQEILYLFKTPECTNVDSPPYLIASVSVVVLATQLQTHRLHLVDPVPENLKFEMKLS
ncbi:F-box protein [Pyrus ussuriensis x Pyrus communis]|uniref:F-box protein n=1 Tax=Pyrus ussuriensis x Pyrus communis TaxID=2448454 RepID=A0A5N5GPL1_9ROSA|nr:F-box protein [Pyrus ussuriensis x Pyrus communis]